MFLAPVPVMLLLLSPGRCSCRNTRTRDAGRLDLLSALLSVVAVLPIIYGIKLAAEGGSLAAASFAAMPEWASHSARGSCAARPPERSTSRSRALQASRGHRRAAIYTFDFFVGFGILIIVAQYLQLVLGLTPSRRDSGARLSDLDLSLGSLLTSPALRLMRPAYVLGCGLTGRGRPRAMALAVHTHSLILIIFGNVCLLDRYGPCTAIIADLIVSAAPQEHSGAASALSEIASELGGALGIALLVALLSHLPPGPQRQGPTNGAW